MKSQDEPRLSPLVRRKCATEGCVNNTIFAYCDKCAPPPENISQYDRKKIKGIMFEECLVLAGTTGLHRGERRKSSIEIIKWRY